MPWVYTRYRGHYSMREGRFSSCTRLALSWVITLRTNWYRVYTVAWYVPDTVSPGVVIYHTPWDEIRAHRTKIVAVERPTHPKEHDLSTDLSIYSQMDDLVPHLPR